MLSVARPPWYATASCEIVLFVCVFYQLKGACPTDTNSTHQSPRNTDPAYIAAATEQFHTVAHGREVGLVAQILEQLWSRVTLLYSLFRRVYRTGVWSNFCPWDDRLPHPSSSGRSTMFNNLPLMPDQPD